MNKKFLIGVLVVILAGIGLRILLSQIGKPDNQGGFTEQEISQQLVALAAKSGQTNVPPPAVLVPIDLAHPLRLAIGGLGLADEDQNRQLGDLVTAQLTGESGINLVERPALAAILHELNLSWSGFVRARDAVRAGKLLKADWFLLGTEARINGTNSIVARMVDARTGVMCDGGVIPADQPATQLAADLAAFVRQCRQNAAHPKPQVFLAIGAFEDVGVNNRQADFPAQLRGYLTAAYRGSSVTLLEREFVETLLQEVHLDMAGLTEESGSNSPPAMQSAYWLVSGQYQSYETTNFQVELNLDIQRAFGKSWHRAVRALPGEPIGRQSETAIDTVMSQNAELIYPTRRTEARMQMEIGRELSNLNGHDLVTSSGNWMEIGQKDPQFIARRKRKIQEAVRAFETALLLEPTNREAKVCLAMCFRHTDIMRIDEACSFYRELIDEPVQDKWSDVAQKALVETFNWYAPEQKLAWLQSSAAQATNQMAAEFYQQNKRLAEQDVVMSDGDSPQAEQYAEDRLFGEIRSANDFFHGKFGTGFRSDFGMDGYLDVFGDDRAKGAAKLAGLLPRMETEYPELAAHLVTAVLRLQPNTNSPAVAEFSRMLTNAVAHPQRNSHSGQMWIDIKNIYWWCLEKTNYPLAVQVLESLRAVAPKDSAVDFGDQEKIELAYAYLAVERWQDALTIFESFNGRPLRSDNEGPWGKALGTILTDKMAAYCRNKLGLAATDDARKLDFGLPVLCLCSPAVFVADQDGLWVGIGGQLLRLDFDLRTNLAIKLPVAESVPITAMALTPSAVWIGTHGAGLVEVDKASRQCHRLSEDDGLMMNDITSLDVAGESLWIGYGGATGGGLGNFNLGSRKLRSFTPSLISDPAVGNQVPPRGKIRQVVAGAAGDVWLSAAGNVRQFQMAHGTWHTLPNENGSWASCFTADSQRLVLGMGINLGETEISTRLAQAGGTNEIIKQEFIVSPAEDRRLQEEIRTNGLHQWVSASRVGGIPPKGALAIQNLRDHHWQTLEDADGLPSPPSTLTLAGDNLWVGGAGAIALVDLKTEKVRKFCHIKAQGVDRIQIGGGYVWAQFDWHLYRVALSGFY